MKGVTRKQGFIDLDELYKSSYYKPIDNKTYKISKDISHSSIRIEFIYDDEIYFYKSLRNKKECYNELIAEELAHDFNIPCAYYDLATTKYDLGVITKNFKSIDSKYYSGNDILSEYIKKIYGESIGTYGHYNLIKQHNSLNGIWNALDYHYRNYENREYIVINIMDKIVDMFIFDVLIGNTDRHDYNWGIVENENKNDLQIIYDHDRLLDLDYNSRFLVDNEEYVSFIKDSLEFNLKILLDFISISDNEYLFRFKDKLKFVKENNLKKVFLRIEKKIDYTISEEIKKDYIERFSNYIKLIEEKLEEFENSRHRK